LSQSQETTTIERRIKQCPRVRQTRLESQNCRFSEAWDDVNIPHPQEGFTGSVGHYWLPNFDQQGDSYAQYIPPVYHGSVMSKSDLKLLTGTHIDDIIF
jgi:hypothetical protein